MSKNKITRRDFLRILGFGSIAFASQPLLKACQPLFAGPTPPPFVGDPDIEIRLIARPDYKQILPGVPTQVWRYEGQLIKGPSDCLLSLAGSYLGPMLNLVRGTKLRVHFENRLPELSIVHWHGLHVPDHADGHPRFAVGEGETYVYDFTVMDRAGTYWYHPHPHGHTGPQVYRGLAGLFLVHDEEEASLNLPSGGHDLPLVIQDRNFSEDNQFEYNNTSMEALMFGQLGDDILINGQPDFRLEVEPGAYRLRMLNGSNARIYKLAWDDGTPFRVIGTDGGLLESPVRRDYLTLAPAQRVDLWVDFGAWRPGSEKKLVSLTSAAPASTGEITILTAFIKDSEPQTSSLAENLTVHTAFKASQAANAHAPRKFDLQMQPGMRWVINGRQFEMDSVARDEEVHLGEMEIWEFRNQAGGGMGMGRMMRGMSQPHPMHVHGLQFKIIDRQIDPSMQEPYQTLKDGFVDEGWHDTVLVMPGETVKILMKFEDYRGLYLYHCHNLEHEDMGMMRNYQIM